MVVGLACMLTKTDLKLIDQTVTRRIKPLKDDVVKVRKDIKIIVNFFDHEYLDLRKRVERIKEH